MDGKIFWVLANIFEISISWMQTDKNTPAKLQFMVKTPIFKHYAGRKPI
jgi:hypothetical protein